MPATSTTHTPAPAQSSPAPRPTSTTPPARPRDALLDNAKFLLITLVFVGHAISPAADTRLTDTVYFWIYLFHMPAFALICGYLSKSFDGTPRRVDKLVTTVVVPYLIFWCIYAGLAHATGRSVPTTPLEPVWLTWFLAALLVWRLTVPLWQRVRMPVVVAVLVCLAGGTVATGDAFGISRILSLLPFFVLGLRLERHHFDLLRRRWVQGCALLVVLGTVLLTYFYLEQLSLEWVYWRESLADRDVALLPVGLAGRLLFLGLAIALTASFFALIPARRTWFTHLGAFTMYVFLLHGVPIRVAQLFDWYDMFEGHLGLLVNAGLAMVLTVVLSSSVVRRATGWLVEPRVDWLLRPLRRDTPRGGATRDDTTPAGSVATATPGTSAPSGDDHTTALTDERVSRK